MHAGGPGLHALDATDTRLVEHLRAGLPVADHPFALVGEALGVPQDEVLDRLSRLLSHGKLARLGPLYRIAAAERLDPVNRHLVAVTVSGLPLVPQPYEAVGALVGISSAEVQERLRAMLARGLILRIAAVLP
jgi:DNA-binding Lrp family transcriptional regulator